MHPGFQELRAFAEAEDPELFQQLPTELKQKSGGSACAAANDRYVNS